MYSGYNNVIEIRLLLHKYAIGGRYWDRTSDPCRVKAVLYR